MNDSNPNDDGFMAALSINPRPINAPLPLFPLGRVVATPGALDIPGSVIHAALDRHHAGDWGDVSPGDKAANDADLKHGGQLLSAYRWGAIKFWIITEADRSATTVLLPEEY